MKSAKDEGSRARPIVYDYGAARDFFHDLLAHYKTTSSFSVRQRLQTIAGCSPALVSQVLAGKRRLTRDQLPSFAKLFKLNSFEFEFIDKNLRGDIWSRNSNAGVPQTDASQSRVSRKTQNHVLSSWLNVYVKDLVHLKGFSLETKVLHKMLMGIASPQKIDRSAAFLLREGFWRRTPAGKIVPEDAALVSTNEIANEKIRDFHKQALKLAQRGLDIFPATRRKASTVLVSLDQEKIPELRSLLDSFQNQLLKFIEDNPHGSDELFQVALHLTPVGGKND